MSSASEIASNEEPDDRSTGSVYDFLYHDARRIASFISQFDDYGSLTGIVQKEAADSATGERTKFEASGSIAAIVKGGGAFEQDVNSGASRESSRTYDPLWTNAVALLEYLDERHLLHRDFNAARIGNIVAFTGDLSVFDLGVLRKMWDLPGVKKLMLAQVQSAKEAESTRNRHERRKSASLSASKSPPDNTEVALEMMTILPHAIQASVADDVRSIWCTLREDSLSISGADMLTKHGLTVSGQWTIIGILDAFPDGPDFHPDDGGPSLSALQQMVAGSRLGFFAFNIAAHLVPHIRNLLGRPAASYGITPLLIFRQIGN